MFQSTDSRDTQIVIWFSSLLRWALGAAAIYFGYAFRTEGAWPAMILGAILIITGFFRPKRCLEDGCTPSNESNNTGSKQEIQYIEIE